MKLEILNKVKQFFIIHIGNMLHVGLNVDEYIKLNEIKEMLLEEGLSKCEAKVYSNLILKKVMYQLSK